MSARPVRAGSPVRLLLALAVLLAASLALAQFASGTDPAQVADQAVQSWLSEPPTDLGTLASLPAEQLCQALPELLRSPPPPAGTRVTFDSRREVESGEEGVRRYSYPASLPGGRLEVVDVRLERAGAGWSATRVGFRVDAGSQGVRGWLQEPLAGWLFVAFSLLVLYLLVRPSFLRRWLAAGARTVRQFRSIVVGTVVAFYAIFFLGALIGTQLPEGCTTAILEVVSSAITSVGATDAYSSLQLPRAAAVTFFQNFGVVTLTMLFSLAFLFGVPAYLLGGLSFLAQGIPFGLLGGLGPLQFVLVGVLLALELTAYFLVVAGGGILLATVVRGGLGAFWLGVQRLAQMLPFALVLLLLGAWYESLIIIVPQLLGGG